MRFTVSKLYFFPSVAGQLGTRDHGIPDRLHRFPKFLLELQGLQKSMRPWLPPWLKKRKNPLEMSNKKVLSIETLEIF